MPSLLVKDKLGQNRNVNSKKGQEEALTRIISSPKNLGSTALTNYIHNKQSVYGIN